VFFGFSVVPHSSHSPYTELRREGVEKGRSCASLLFLFCSQSTESLSRSLRGPEVSLSVHRNRSSGCCFLFDKNPCPEKELLSARPLHGKYEANRKGFCVVFECAMARLRYRLRSLQKFALQTFPNRCNSRTEPITARLTSTQGQVSPS